MFVIYNIITNLLGEFTESENGSKTALIWIYHRIYTLYSPPPLWSSPHLFSSQIYEREENNVGVAFSLSDMLHHIYFSCCILLFNTKYNKTV